MSWTLPELIDIPNLQMLMDRFHAATGIPVGIIAVDGEFLVATGWAGCHCPRPLLRNTSISLLALCFCSGIIKVPSP